MTLGRLFWIFDPFSLYIFYSNLDCAGIQVSNRTRASPADLRTPDRTYDHHQHSKVVQMQIASIVCRAKVIHLEHVRRAFVPGDVFICRASRAVVLRLPLPNPGIAPFRLGSNTWGRLGLYIPYYFLLLDTWTPFAVSSDSTLPRIRFRFYSARRFDHLLRQQLGHLKKNNNPQS